MSVIPIEDRYLGDGVYASYDGYHFVLDLRAQDSTTRIALEPAVLNELARYATYVYASKIENETPLLFSQEKPNE